MYLLIERLKNGMWVGFNSAGRSVLYASTPLALANTARNLGFVVRLANGKPCNL